MTTVGCTPMSCAGCKHRNEQRLCDYASDTGRTRLGTIMQELGTDHGPEWEAAIKPKNCKLWEPKAKGVFRRKASEPPKLSRHDANGNYYHRLVEKEARGLMGKGYSDKQIATMKQWDPIAVKKFREKYIAEAKLRVEAVLKTRTMEIDEARRHYYAEGLSDYDIAQRTNTTERTIFEWRKRNNLPPTHRPPVKREDGRTVKDFGDEIMNLYRAGMTDWEIGKIIGYDRSTIGSWRRSQGLSPNVAKGKRANDDRQSD